VSSFGKSAFHISGDFQMLDTRLAVRYWKAESTEYSWLRDGRHRFTITLLYIYIYIYIYAFSECIPKQN